MTVPGASPRLDVYDVAFLAGGPDRVVDTALVALVGTGRLRIHRPGQLVTVALARRHPVEAAVLDAVGPTGHRSADTIRWRLREDDRVLEPCARLRRAGLLRPSGAVVVLSSFCPAVARTRAGRQVLRELRGRSADGTGTELMRVALDGRQQLTDSRLRAEIFESPTTTLPPPVPGHRTRGVDHSDPRLAAYRTGGNAAVGGAVLYGGS